MNEHIEWVIEQRNEAQSLVQKTEAEYVEAKTALSEAQRALGVWDAALHLAQPGGEKVKHGMADLVAGATIKAKAEVVRKPTISNLAEQVIREHGPLGSRGVQRALEEKGKHTTVNTVTVTLNRERPERFDRDNDGKWYLPEREAIVAGSVSPKKSGSGGGGPEAAEGRG